MRRRSIFVPLAVLAVGVSVSLAAGRNVAATAERELDISLERAGSEIGMLIQGLAYGFDAELSSLAAIATVTDGDPALQDRFARDQGLEDGYVLVDATVEPPRVLAAVGADEAVAGQQRSLAEAFLSDPRSLRQLLHLVDTSSFGFVLGDGDSPTLALAAGATGGAGGRYVALRLFDVGEAGLFLTEPMAGVEAFAVYVGDAADPARAILASTTELPLPGTTTTKTTDLGDQPLLVQVGGSPKPSVSPVAVAGIGLLLSVALASLVSVALGRRDAAVRALAAAERADRQFRAALLASPDVILRWDLEDDEVDVLNRPSFYGHPADDVRGGEDLLAVVEPEHRHELLELCNGSDAHGAEEGLDVRVRDADGCVRWAHLRVSWMQEDRRASDLLIVVTDVDEVRRAEHQHAAMEAELQQAQRMETIGQLAGGIAHDFNNLLAAIASTAELVLTEVDDPATTADLEAILDATQRGAALTSRLLSFSRRGLSRREELELDAVVSDMGELLRRTLGEHITLAVRTGAPGAHVLGDPGELEQVLLNLVVNARDAAAGPGLRIDVETARVGADVVLTVRDDGVGMPIDVSARAFEPFFSTKPADRGTGLGLSIVYGIATRMGGSVAIDSSPGAGTTIRVTLPCTESEATGAGIPAASAPLEAPHELVLLVEDEPAVRRAAQRLLERSGHTVVAAADGHEAVGAVTDGLVPTVLLTDVVLPGTLTGHEVAEHVRAAVPGVRVVYASGYAQDVLTAEQIEVEHAAFIAKPFTSQALLHAVSDTPTRQPS